MIFNRSSYRLFKLAVRNVIAKSQRMAKSNYEYVKNFEEDGKCLLDCWIVVRIDGKGFHRFTELHQFEKPNDLRGLNLMSKAAASVMDEFRDIILAFGHSDEYSFIFRKKTNIFNRRSQKILSLVSSLFSSSYVYHWRDYFDEKTCPLRFSPAFDARLVLYPSDKTLRDYLSWRQIDVHINHQYNLCFWSLVLKKELTPKQAEERLRGTLSSDKNEILFSEFNINYNDEPEMFRKGTILIRKVLEIPRKECDETVVRSVVIPLHCDLIKDKFWKEHPELLNGSPSPKISYLDEMDFYEMRRACIKGASA